MVFQTLESIASHAGLFRSQREKDHQTMNLLQLSAKLQGPIRQGAVFSFYKHCVPNLTLPSAFPNGSRWLALIFFFLVGTGFRSLLAHSSTYSWPIRTDRFLSATFGEPRVGHFHSGVDIKTWGALDIPCQAVANGYIQRVRVGYTGYGKVLYLKLNDGRTAVYAHLDRFTWAIERLIIQEQQKTGRYAVELTFPPERFPVKKNAVLAYSGTSGTRYPHLHFEIRDSTGAVLNPLQFFHGIQDRKPPEIKGLYLIPLDDNSRLNGGWLPLRLPLIKRGAKYRSAFIPYVSGPVGLAVATFDRADGTSNWYSIYNLRLTVDDSLAFALTFNREPLSYAHQVEVVYEVGLADERKPVLNLYLPENSPGLPFIHDGLDGRLQLSPGLHRLRAEFKDFHGNTADLTFYLTTLTTWPVWKIEAQDNRVWFISSSLGTSPIFYDLRHNPVKPHQVLYDLSNARWEFLLEELRQGLTVAPLKSLPLVGLYFPQPVNLPDLEADWEKSPRGWVLKLESLAPVPFPIKIQFVLPYKNLFIPLIRVTPTQSQTEPVSGDIRGAVKDAVLHFGPRQELHFPQRPWLKLGPGDSYSDVVSGFNVSFRVEATSDSFHLQVDTALASYNDLHFSGLGLFTLEEGVNFTAQMAFRIPTGQEERHWGIYRQAHGLRLLPGSIKEAGYITVEVNKPGRYFLIADDNPPRIRLLTKRRVYRPGQRVVWRIRDNAGPIARPEQNIIMRWDGQIVFPNWNPLRQELTYHLPWESKSGVHIVDLKVVDQQGHIAKKRYRFRLHR